MSTQQPRRSPRKHKRKTDTKKAAKQVEPALPQIKWTADDGALTWALIAQLEIKENRLVLFGKDNKDENTSGDSKIAVYKRIGGVILPDLFAASPNALAKRVKCKAESLVDTYKNEVKKLRVTGGGLENNDDSEGSQHEDDSETQNNGEDNVHQFLACYISPAGPDHDTTPKARNIWEKITKDFKYFPALHKFLAARSNIIPPVITTGVGPEGRKVVHLQPPTQRPNVGDELIDPSLRNPATPPRMQQQLNPGSSPIEIPDSSPTPADTKPPRSQTIARPSTFQNMINKAKTNAPGPRKKTFEDSLIEIQIQMLASANARENAKLEHDRSRLRMEEIHQIIELNKIGVLDKEAVAERIKIVEARYADPPKRARSRSPSEAGPSKRHHRGASSSSSRWNDSPGSSPEHGSDTSLGSR